MGNVDTTLTVSPGQSFAVDVTWTGGGTTANTVAKWPTNFNSIGIVRNNSQFVPTPVMSPVGVNPSGSLVSVLTAPNTPGVTHILRVYAATGNPFETDFMDINVFVVTPPAQTYNISGFKLNSIDNSSVPGWFITLTNDTMNTTVTTDVNGMYQFTGLMNGTYTVTEHVQAGWTNVTPTSIIVLIAGADVLDQNFTNMPPVTP
ncbi:MAG: SpaA isopeptide-forming pilin-related protein, partial [ANME-2 cluster archaeon]|nr:SpaA isopeptide-forming pilin-related protein [ANME-2 cluster archaeon]